MAMAWYVVHTYSGYENKAKLALEDAIRRYALEHKFGENQTRYEPAHEGEHHDHLICIECGAIVEFEDPMIEARQERVAEERGFEVVSHRHEVYVRCVPGRCRKEEAAAP